MAETNTASDKEATETQRQMARRRWDTRIAVAALAVVAALLAMASVTYALASPRPDTPATPATSSVAAGFARDMSAHHAQAVRMSFLVRENTNAQDVRRLAYDIINTQATQRGMMLGWLKEWGLPLARPGQAMAWMPDKSGMPAMEGSGPDRRMAGMATSQELDALRSADGRKAEVLFLQLMTQHHQGGVVMARAAVKQTSRPTVEQLAQKMVTGQQAEIKLMTRMLRQRDAKPLPWPPESS